jgi:hypothetical protein
MGLDFEEFDTQDNEDNDLDEEERSNQYAEEISRSSPNVEARPLATIQSSGPKVSILFLDVKNTGRLFRTLLTCIYSHRQFDLLSRKRTSNISGTATLPFRTLYP